MKDQLYVNRRYLKAFILKHHSDVQFAKCSDFGGSGDTHYVIFYIVFMSGKS